MKKHYKFFITLFIGMVSLMPGIEYTSGDGSKNDPYIIDTSSN